MSRFSTPAEGANQLLTAMLLMLLAPLILLTAFFLTEVAAGMLPLGRETAALSSPEAVIVVPAHDEASIIERTLSGLNAALGIEMRLLVVADNCSDDTAARALAAGAEVIQRDEPSRRGKGFALDFAVEHLANCPPEILVVIDADCQTDAASLKALVHSAARWGRPCQAVNLLIPNREAPAMVQISAFAFMLKNLIRQRGLQRLAGRVHLTGTGMAFPFGLLSGAGLGNDDIVEDISLGLRMAQLGHAPALVPQATVVSGAGSAKATLIQRKRWEGGFLRTAFHQSPRLMASALRTGNLRAVAAALDLMVPPFALLMLANLAALAVAFALTFCFGLGWAPVLVQAALVMACSLLVLLVWVTNGREFLSVLTLMLLPFYLLWKLPLYLSLALHGAPREWLRPGR